MPVSNKDIEKYFTNPRRSKEAREYFGEHYQNRFTSLFGEFPHDGILNFIPNLFRGWLGDDGEKERVYILPGIMGSELYVDQWPDKLIWLHLLGGIRKGNLAMLEYGLNPIIAKDVLKLFYFEMRTALRFADYHADFLPFDWRLPVQTAAQQLFDQIVDRGEKDVVLVCHSMGGLLARHMTGLDPYKQVIRKVITAGTPNYGSYSPVNVFTHAHPVLQMVDRLDDKHDMQQLVDDYVRYFPGLMEMLPSPRKRPDERFFELDFWPNGEPSSPVKNVIESAFEGQDSLPPPDSRYVQIIGMNQSTIQSAPIRDGKFAFERTGDGDGTVPRELAEMGDVLRYYVDCEHQQLAMKPVVIAAVKDIIKDGVTDKLRSSPDLRPQSAIPETTTVRSDEFREITRQRVRNDEDVFKSMLVNDSTGRITDNPFS